MDIRSYLVKVGLWTNHSVKGKIEEILPVHFPLGLWRQRRLATIATAVEGDGGGVSTAAAVGTAAAEAGGLQPWQQRRRFATMEAAEGGGGRRWRRRRAAEGGGGSSMDVLDVRFMGDSDSTSSPYKPTVGIEQRPKSRFLPPAEG
jgi:hypothetical protein